MYLDEALAVVGCLRLYHTNESPCQCVRLFRSNTRNKGYPIPKFNAYGAAFSLRGRRGRRGRRIVKPIGNRNRGGIRPANVNGLIDRFPILNFGLDELTKLFCPIVNRSANVARCH